MQRTLVLSKGAYLWHEGDRADNIAMVENGRLAVTSSSGLVGIAIPKTVIGEGALVPAVGGTPVRTASVVAMEDDTRVVEHSAERVKQTIDGGQHEVGHQILMTLMVQTCRNILVVNATNQESELVGITLKGLIKGLIGSAEAVTTPKSWAEFTSAFQFLHALRNMSLDLRNLVGRRVSDESLERAHAGAKQFFEGKDILPMMEEALRAERDKAAWLETSPGA